MDEQRMRDIGAQLVSRAIAQLYTTKPVGPNHRAYRPLIDHATWTMVAGEPQPWTGYDASIVRIPKGFRLAWSADLAERNLVARVSYALPDDRGTIALKARSFDTDSIADDRLVELVREAADRYAIKVKILD